MHDGFKVIDVHAGTMTTACRFDEHGSLAYGADWALAADGSTRVATCSFYDHALIYSSLSS